MNTDKNQWQLLDGSFDRLAFLPVSTSHFKFILNEPGSGSVSIPMDSRAAQIVQSGMFALASYRGAPRGGFSIDNVKRDYVSEDNQDAGLWMEMSGSGELVLLEDGIVMGDGDGTKSTRKFDGGKASAIITAIQEAQSRTGCLQNIVCSFDADEDTEGNGWEDTEPFSINVGTNLLEMVRQISKYGIDFNMVLSGSTFTLNAYRNGIGTDRSGTVFMRVGKNCKLLNSDERSGSLKNALVLGYRDGFIQVKDDASISAHRRREKYLDVKNAQSSSAATTYGAAVLESSKYPRKSITVKVYDGISHRLFVDYGMGDTISVDNKGSIESYRVLGIQCDWDGARYSNVVLELNDMFTESDIKMFRDIDWLMNQWNTARDSNLLAVSYWGALGLKGDGITSINALLKYGDNIFVGGSFTKIGGVVSTDFGVYNIPTGKFEYQSGVVAILTCFAVSGDYLYAGAEFGQVYRCNMDNWVWEQIGGSHWDELLGKIWGIAAIDDKVYVGGFFNSMEELPASYIAAFDTVSEEWEELEDGVGNTVRDVLKVGDKLYVVGEFEDISAVPINHVAVWDTVSSSWSSVGSGIDGVCSSVCEYGNGILVAEVAGKVWRWENSAWSLFAEVDGTINDIDTYLTDLYVAGSFTDVGNNIAKYSGGSWMQLGEGTSGAVNKIAMNDDDVYVAGNFQTVDGNKAANQLAVYISNFESLSGYLENSTSGFNMGAAIHNAPASVITDEDEIPFWENVSNALRKITWENVKATLKTYLDTLYISLANTDWSALTGGGETELHTHPDGGGGTPGGSDGEMQYNNAGTFGGLSGFYWDPTNGIVYLGRTGEVDSGITSGDVVLTLLAKDDNKTVVQSMHAWGDGSLVNPTMAFYRSRGTRAAPTALMSGDRLLNFAGFGHDGTAWVGSLARMLYKATENFSSTAHGTGIYFEGISRGSTTRSEFLAIDENGTDLPIGAEYLVNGVPHTHPSTIEPMQRIAIGA